MNRKLGAVLLSALSFAVRAQDLGCYEKCLGQGRTSQLCSSLCRSSQTPSITIRPLAPESLSSLSQQGPLSGINSPEALRAKCTIQKDINACRQLQELSGVKQPNISVENGTRQLVPSQAQQFNQKLQEKRVPEYMRVKCLVEFDLGVCKEIDEILIGKRPAPTSNSQ